MSSDEAKQILGVGVGTMEQRLREWTLDPQEPPKPEPDVDLNSIIWCWVSGTK